MGSRKILDVMGTRVHLGDTVVYPVRRGSDLALKKGVVCEPPGKGCVVKKGLVVWTPGGRRVVIQATDRCAVIRDFWRGHE